MTTEIDNALAGLSASSLMDVVAAAARRLAAAERPAIVDRETLTKIEDREEHEYAPVQWLDKTGKSRAPLLRALSAGQRLDASKDAHRFALQAFPTRMVPLPSGGHISDPALDEARADIYRQRLVCEETARMIVRPDGITGADIARLNGDVVLALHEFGERLEALPHGIISAELERVADGIPPDPATTAAEARDRNDTDSGGVDGSDGPTGGAA